MKNSMNGVLSSLACVASMSAAASFLPMKTHLGLAGTFWLYAGFCFLLMLVFYVCVPETKGESLGTIERKLTSSSDLGGNKSNAMA
jgi:SP family arabinose:H+ symporter-like MFS transporter